MTALNDLSDIVNKCTGGNGGNPENLFIFKDARIDTGVVPVNNVAGRMTSLWRNTGNPSNGAIPTTPFIPTNTTPGGLLRNNPAIGKEKFLMGMTASSLNAGTLFLYDQLTCMGGLSGTVTTNQTVGLTIDRNVSGVGNQIQIEIFTIIGTTARTITATYKNENGDTHETPPTAIGATGFREVGRIIILPLLSGDRGVTEVISVKLSDTTGTAGTFGVNITNPIAIMPLSIAGIGSVRDFISGLPSMPKIETNACLFLTWLASTTVPPTIFLSLHFIDS